MAPVRSVPVSLRTWMVAAAEQAAARIANRAPVVPPPLDPPNSRWGASVISTPRKPTETPAQR